MTNTNKAPADLELPDALEQALAYKNERASQMGGQEASQEATPEPEVGILDSYMRPLMP